LVARELNKIFDPKDSGKFNPTTANIDVYTNLDPVIQKHTYDSINSKESGLFEDKKIQAGSVILNSNNGAILGVGNGRNGHASFGGTNFAFNYPRQPGSTAKPIIDYAPAIEFLEWSTAHQLNDKKINYDGGSAVGNHDGSFLGKITLDEALAKSRNPTALQTFKEVANQAGLNKIMEFASSLGITDVDPETFNQAYSIGGWTTGTTPVELAAAYAAFGNGGYYNAPKTIRKITIREASPYSKEFGKEFKYKDEPQQVMKPSTAYMIKDILNTNNPNGAGLGGSIRSPFSSFHAKTGTTNWDASGEQLGIPDGTPRDKWVVGFNEKITSAVWTGFTQEEESKGTYMARLNASAVRLTNKLLGVFNNHYPDYLDGTKQARPSNIVSVKIKKGSWPPVEDSKGTSYLFITGSEDHKKLKEDFSKTTAPTPNVQIKNDKDGSTLNWTYSGDFKSGATWNVFIDGKLFKNTNKMSIRITKEEMAEIAGCKDTFEIGVQLLEKDENKTVRKSAIHRSLATFSSDDYCKEEIPIDPPPEVIFDFFNWFEKLFV